MHRFARMATAAAVGVAACATLTLPAIAATPSASTSGNDSVSSSPPDRKVYRGSAPTGIKPNVTGIRPNALPAGFLLTDATSSASSSGGNEPAIAVNPANPNQIAITRFNDSWGGGNADLLYSTDAGQTFTEQMSIPVPPGIGGTSGCPCDQTIDYGRDGTLYGTFLTDDDSTGTEVSQIVTGSTTDPTSASAWSWNGNPAQLNSGTRTNADQPWLLVNRDPSTAGQDDVYVGYDDFAGAPDMRVAASDGVTPVNVTIDNKAGTASPLVTNPGLRLAADRSNGAMYAMYEQSSGSGQPKSVTYKLNRSTDGGATWSLNGSSDGLTVDTVNSDQAPGFKFGSVNALLGGVDHVAVDPNNGDVYVVYGQDVSGGNQIMIRRLTSNGSGGLNVGAASAVSTSTDAALPSVAVATDGSVGVLYDSFDGNTASGFPTFSAHFARSTDQGATFSDTTLQSFQSPVTNNTSDDRQRILGDFQQLKSVGKTFYGTFAGNTGGVPASGTPPIDAIFFSFTQPPPASTLTYTGATTADFHDAFTASATLASAGNVGGATVHFALGAGTGSEACDATTDAGGNAACTITPTEAAQDTTLTASFAGNSAAGPSSTTVPFTITREETALAYTGPTHIANGVPTQFSSALTEDGTAPIAGRTVTVTIGSGASAQSCDGTTDGSGVASCAITPNQPLNAAGTVPLTASFGGDGFYLPSSASATLLLQFMTGRAFGISATIALPLLPVVQVGPAPDTGPVRTAAASTTTVPCSVSLNGLVMVTAGGICPQVVTTLNPGTSTATTTIGSASIGVAGIPAISVSGLTATSTSTCTSATGSTTLAKLTIGGRTITVPTTPNTVINLAGVGKLVINEQVPVAGADQGRTVNALHLTALGGTIDLVIGSATSDAHNCG